MKLINEIREYINQERNIKRTLERLDNASYLNRDYTAGSDEQEAVDMLNNRYEYQQQELHRYVKFTCEAFSMTVEYFIGCVNQYTEALTSDT